VLESMSAVPYEREESAGIEERLGEEGISDLSCDT